MKLIECYVSSFGNLKDFSYTFCDGLNTVKEENGWGKSTFASFIKSMFYGLNDSKHGIDDNERKRFAPWNSTEKFGGNLVFEWKGQRFKIERFFGSKASEDTVKVYDISTNKEYDSGSAVQDIGKRVFSIDEEGFLSTTYLSQKDFEVKSNTSITAKYNEVYEIKDSGAFDKAIAKLDEKIKTLKIRGDKGRIADLKREIIAVEDNIEHTKRSLSAIDTMKKDLEVLQKESDTLSLNIKKLTAKLQSAGKKEATEERKRRYDALTAELKTVMSEEAETDSVLNGKTVTCDNISCCESCLRDIYDLSAKAETLEKDVEEYAEKPSRESAKISRGNVAGFVASAVLVLAGAIIAAFLGLWGLSIAGAGVITGLFALVTYNKTRNEAQNEKRAGDKIAEIYERKKRELEDIKRERAKLIKGLDEFFSGFNIEDGGLSYERKITVIKDAAVRKTELNKLKEKAQAELSELKALGVETDISVTESVSELNERLRVATEWFRQKVSETERINSRIDALESSADALCDLENRKAELKERLSDSERELKILTLTEKYLTEADETLKSKYRAPLEESLNKYLRMVTGQDVTVNVDTDMKVSVMVSGALRATEYFSKGYRNLFEICKRFALTDILFNVEKPFMILDDPFCNLDDAKTAEALSLVKKLSEEYQILYFICHESRRA